eukprot:194928-Prymnesium_polylepis.2
MKRGALPVIFVSASICLSKSVCFDLSASICLSTLGSLCTSGTCLALRTYSEMITIACKRPFREWKQWRAGVGGYPGVTVCIANFMAEICKSLADSGYASTALYRSSGANVATST